MTITFYGAASEVTGSKHLIEWNGKRILLDCGLFQGPRKISDELNRTLPFDAQSIDACILSHAHIDHCGLLPVLIKNGYRGSIYATPATKELTAQMLHNIAGIQESDYVFMQKHGIPGQKFALPFIRLADIPPTMERFVTHPYVRQGGDWREVFPGVRFKFYDAGHILGSAVIVIEFSKSLNYETSNKGWQTSGDPRQERTSFSERLREVNSDRTPDNLSRNSKSDGEKMIRLAFTGDLGRAHTPLLHDPEPIAESIDILISESTYGGHIHHSVTDAEHTLKGIIGSVVKQKGRLIVPAFALGRTQEFVYMLHKLTDQKKIPRIPVYVDSPLATNLTKIFIEFRADYDTESKKDFPAIGDTPFFFQNLIYTQSKEESQGLNKKKGPLIIIAASGMAEGGRILHHLKHGLRSKTNTVLFTGFQAARTLGRKILEGQSPVRVFNHWYQVKANIEVLNELSAHADTNELTEYIANIHGLKKIFLVHGEPDRAEKLKNQIAPLLPTATISIPKMNETVTVS